jgi:uncharacterized protein (DUF427 family)
MKAIWNDTLIAESDETVVVEGNHYFPAAHVNSELLQASGNTTHCPWKGTASYYDIVVGEQINPGAAWYYAEPKEAAAQIKGRIAFWRGVQVVAD